MKKIFYTFIFFCAIFCSAAVFACSQDNVVMRGGILTGAACSISDLNNLEKNKSVTKRADFLPMGERNLRPSNTKPVRPLSNFDDCLFGRCLYRKVLQDESK